ncbi:MAG: allantoinase AllB [Nitriliruptor sp.]
MEPADLVLISRRLVTEDGERPGAVVVAGERIVALLDTVEPGELPAAARTEDVGELALMAGFVDAHVHVNEPGRTEWEGYATATRAAAAAGITTIVDMPLNSVPPTIDPPALAAKRDAARPRISVDVGFWGGVVPGSERHLADLYAEGVFGFKAFTCASGVPEYGDFAPSELDGVVARTARIGATLLVHAEDPDVVDAATAAVAAADPNPRAHSTWLAGRPPEAELRAIAAALDAARANGGAVHVLHLSTAEGLASIAAARAEGVAVTVETCPHYLTLAAEDVPDGATSHKCAPPIRDGANRERLWAGLADGTIDAIVSDHSPAPPSSKAVDTGSFVDAWGGISSLQLGPSLVWTEAQHRGHDLVDLTRWMASGPARVAGLTRKGRLAVGADADLVVFDPDLMWTVDVERLHHRHAFGPYHGRQLRGRAVATYLRGRSIAGVHRGSDPADVLEPPSGQLLTRGDA